MSQCIGITYCLPPLGKTSSYPYVTNKLPEPFPIPLFRKVTMDALAQKRYTTDDRKYMIRVLSTMILTHIEKATMSDCANVSKALTLKYPFLGDYVSDTTYTLV